MLALVTRVRPVAGRQGPVGTFVFAAVTVLGTLATIAGLALIGGRRKSNAR